MDKYSAFLSPSPLRPMVFDWFSADFFLTAVLAALAGLANFFYIKYNFIIYYYYPSASLTL